MKIEPVFPGPVDPEPPEPPESADAGLGAWVSRIAAVGAASVGLFACLVSSKPRHTMGVPRSSTLQWEERRAEIRRAASESGQPPSKPGAPGEAAP
ncbi:MAG: hypothetical protein AAB215_10010 [Planctomycetota bacterium]